MSKISIPDLKAKKDRNEKIIMLTAYDYPTAKILEEINLDLILVGDSVGNVVLGYDSTVPVTMEEMLHHTKAVRRGAKNTFLIADMPFLSYQVSDTEALRNAGRFIKEAGSDAVKVEGGRNILDRIKAIIKAGIPVLGHLGLTPQTATMLGGLKTQGRSLKDAERIYQDSIILEEAGCFALVLECVPQQLAKVITQKLSIPVIGIGAGKFCDGQVLVTPDILGISEDFKPKFVKQYLNLHKSILDALSKFKTEVQNGKFPSPEQSFNMKPEVLNNLMQQIKKSENE